jgi:hypothetical protein
MCDYGDCAHLSTVPSPEPGSWIADLVDFFEGLFGGGGGQPTFIPRGYRRVAHYPAIYFITDSQAQLEEYTPDLKQKSDTIEILIGLGVVAAVIVAPELIPLVLEGGEEALAVGGAAVEEGGPIAAEEAAPFSRYIDTTDKGALIKNITTNVSGSDVGTTLEANGFTPSVSADGRAISYTNADGDAYTIRPSNSAPGGSAANYTPSGSGSPTLKINFGPGIP